MLLGLAVAAQGNRHRLVVGEFAGLGRADGNRHVGRQIEICPYLVLTALAQLRADRIGSGLR